MALAPRTEAHTQAQVGIALSGLEFRVISWLQNIPGLPHLLSGLFFLRKDASHPESLSHRSLGHLPPGWGPSSPVLPGKYFSAHGDQLCITDGTLNVNHPPLLSPQKSMFTH